jgi:hypothetical protein
MMRDDRQRTGIASSISGTIRAASFISRGCRTTVRQPSLHACLQLDAHSSSHASPHLWRQTRPHALVADWRPCSSQDTSIDVSSTVVVSKSTGDLPISTSEIRFRTQTCPASNSAAIHPPHASFGESQVTTPPPPMSESMTTREALFIRRGMHSKIAIEFILGRGWWFAKVCSGTFHLPGRVLAIGNRALGSHSEESSLVICLKYLANRVPKVRDSKPLLQGVGIRSVWSHYRFHSYPTTGRTRTYLVAVLL